MDCKRVLIIQDISCVGRCSMTVALPILSAWGHETCILPTAVLSTHTGGFGAPAAVHLEGELEKIRRHWQENQIYFDGILVGYLGSIGAVEAVEKILDTMLAPGGIAVVDPVMGDNGRLYSGFDEGYAEAMGRLCRKAHVIIPNLTEAALLIGLPYGEDPEHVNVLLEKTVGQTVVLTGVSFGPEETGVAVRSREGRRHYAHKKVGGSFHGTGDLFAACFTGALLRGRDVYGAVKTAADFVCESIQNTPGESDRRFGVRFEGALPGLIRAAQEK